MLNQIKKTVCTVYVRTYIGGRLKVVVDIIKKKDSTID